MKNIIQTLQANHELALEADVRATNERVLHYNTWISEDHQCTNTLHARSHSNHPKCVVPELSTSLNHNDKAHLWTVTCSRRKSTTHQRRWWKRTYCGRTKEYYNLRNRFRLYKMTYTQRERRPILSTCSISIIFIKNTLFELFMYKERRAITHYY